jgi:uncharacterized RDD family membrane protein YckC
VTAAELSRADGRAILWNRWLAAWVDFVVVFAILAIPDYVLGNERYQRTMILWIPLCLAYYPLLEGLTGRTIGHRLAGITVVDSHGRIPGIAKASIRFLLRFVEVNPFLLGGLPAAVVVWCSRDHQRLGDMAAGTYVLRVRDVPRISAAPPASDDGLSRST